VGVNAILTPTTPSAAFAIGEKSAARLAARPATDRPAVRRRDSL